MEANRLNKLTQQARRESYSLNHDYIGSEHLLLALMKTGSVATKALEKAGANYDLLRQVVINNIGKGQAVRPATEYSKKVRQILELARLNASKFGQVSAGEENVLFAILADDDSLTNIMFLLSGVEKDVVKENLKELLKQTATVGKANNELSENVSKYAKDLNKEADEGKIDPVIGRDEEIERVIQILMRRTKNNPILIGEPGVGKTAISEGLAQRIVNEDVPLIMADKTILSLDMASMIAGTKYRGDFEDRLKKLFDELSTRDDVILFIDEFHMVLGAGAAEGSMDAANILKPILAKGDIQIIGATTIEEYRKYIEKDSALTRRMQPIQVDEPSLADTRKIIYGIKDQYESHHGVEITDEAIDAAVELTDRYINDRFLPDKAIDVIDEAMSKVRIKAYQEKEEESNPEDKINELVKAKEEAVRDQDFEKAAELRDKINQARFEIEAEAEKKNKDKENEFIGYDDIAAIVASWSKVPVEKLTEDEKEINDFPVLKKENILLNQKFDSKEAVIREVGRIMQESGYVDHEYTKGMLDRENEAPTHFGIGLAIPHGTNETKSAIKKSGLVVFTIPEGVKWDDETVKLVIGIAGVGDEHLSILSNVATKIDNEEIVNDIVANKSQDEIYEILTSEV